MGVAQQLERWTAKLAPSRSANTGVIGIDCAMDAMHLVQLEASDGQHCLRASASQSYGSSREAALAEPARMRELLKSAFAQGPFKGKRVVTVLPTSEVEIYPVTYHVNTAQSEAMALNKALTERLDRNLSELVIDYVPVRSPDNEERTALVAVADRARVIEYLELFRRAGLTVECLEIGPVAIRRFVRAIGRLNSVENVMTVNFGRTASFITVISGRRLLMDQQVAFGEVDLVQEIAAALDIEEARVPSFVAQMQAMGRRQEAHTDPDLSRQATATLKEILTPRFMALVEEINRILIYTASQTRGESVSRIYLLGSLARWPAVDAFLNNLTHLEVETIPNPLAAFAAGERTATMAPAPELAVATGLSLHGLLPDDEI